MKNIILNLPVLLPFVDEVIHVASLAGVVWVHGLQVFCCPDINQISSVFHNKIAFVEGFHSLRNYSVKNGYNSKSIKLSTHLDAATLVLDVNNLDPMFWVIGDGETGDDGLQPFLLLPLGLSGAATAEGKSLKSHNAPSHETVQLETSVELMVWGHDRNRNKLPNPVPCELKEVNK